VFDHTSALLSYSDGERRANNIGVLIDYRLVCEKLTLFPYAECIVEFCEGVAFL